MADQAFDPDMYTKMLNLTTPYHRDVYPSVSPTNPSLSAAGKIVLITGTSRGIGFGIAPSWAAAGAAGIVVTARKIESLEAVTKAIKDKSATTEVMAVACDISDEAAVKNLFEEIKTKFGKLDVVIANAGVMSEGEKFLKIGEGDVGRGGCRARGPRYCNNTNIRGTYLTAHYYISTFGSGGVIITFTSGAAALTIPGMSSYGITKHACIKIVEYLGLEYPTLRSFALNPGIVKESDTVPAFTPFAMDTVALIGGFTLWLASGKADGLSGGYMSVNWDVDVLEKNVERVKEGKLLNTAFLNFKFGPEASLLE